MTENLELIGWDEWKIFISSHPLKKRFGKKIVFVNSRKDIYPHLPTVTYAEFIKTIESAEPLPPPPPPIVAEQVRAARQRNLIFSAPESPAPRELRDREEVQRNGNSSRRKKEGKQSRKLAPRIGPPKERQRRNRQNRGR